jgi:hypothetical protein
MHVPWEQAKSHLENLSYPNIGYRGDWDDWYERAWQLLSTAGLTKVEKPVDLTIVTLRLGAMCWLVHDFCAAVEGNEWATVPCWNEWIKELDIDPVVAALLLNVSGKSPHLLLDASLTNVELLSSDEENVWLWEVDGLSKRLWPQVVMNAVFQQRDDVMSALNVGFDGLIPLFESMFECTGECTLSHTSPERMRGYQWIEECSRVIVTGSPEVNLPDPDCEGPDAIL